MTVTVTTRNGAERRLLALQGSVRTGRVVKTAALTVADRVRDNFALLQQTRPNRLGGRRTNFWAGALKSTSVIQTAPLAATVGVAQIGVRQRLEGGTIRAGRSLNPKTGRPTQFIAIPLTADAYGKRPAERHDLDFAIVPGIGPALVEARATEIRLGKPKKDGTRKITQVKSRTGLVPLYRLVRSVTQAPDPTVLPTLAEMSRAADLGAMRAVRAALQIRGGAQ